MVEKLEVNTPEIDQGTLPYLRRNYFGNSLVISDLRSENKGSGLSPGHYLYGEVSSLQ